MRTGTLVHYQRNFEVRTLLAWALWIDMGVLPESTWQQQSKGLMTGRSLELLYSVQCPVWQTWGTFESRLSSIHNSQAVNPLGNWTVQTNQLWFQLCIPCDLRVLPFLGYAAWSHIPAIQNCQSCCQWWQNLSLQRTQNHAGILHGGKVRTQAWHVKWVVCTHTTEQLCEYYHKLYTWCLKPTPFEASNWVLVKGTCVQLMWCTHFHYGKICQFHRLLGMEKICPSKYFHVENSAWLYTCRSSITFNTLSTKSCLFWTSCEQFSVTRLRHGNSTSQNTWLKTDILVTTIIITTVQLQCIWTPVLFSFPTFSCLFPNLFFLPFLCHVLYLSSPLGLLLF